jgi:hypothetical protein
MRVRSAAGIHEARMEQTLTEATEIPGTMVAINTKRSENTLRQE